MESLNVSSMANTGLYNTGVWKVDKNATNTNNNNNYRRTITKQIKKKQNYERTIVKIIRSVGTL